MQYCFGKGFDFLSLLSTPNIQLPPPLTSCLKLRGGGQTEDELTDRTHTRIVSFIVLDNGYQRLACVQIIRAI